MPCPCGNVNNWYIRTRRTIMQIKERKTKPPLVRPRFPRVDVGNKKRMVKVKVLHTISSMEFMPFDFVGVVYVTERGTPKSKRSVYPMFNAGKSFPDELGGVIDFMRAMRKSSMCIPYSFYLRGKR